MDNVVLALFFAAAGIIALLVLLLIILLLDVLKKLRRMGKSLYHIWKLLQNIVVVPSVSVKIDKKQYLRGETVQISGSVSENSVPQDGALVNLKVTLPDGSDQALPDTTTDANGNFTSQWPVPGDAAGGSFTVSATALGTTDTTTFTCRSHPKKGEHHKKSRRRWFSVLFPLTR